MTRLSATLIVSVLSLALPCAARAQGGLSTQGLGFPQGQLSTAAITMGGSIGEIDPFSPLNPATIGLLSTAILMMQAEPEFRVLDVGNLSQRSSVSRFPLFMGTLPIGSRWALSASASTLLDRTWATATRDTQLVGGDSLFSNATQKSDGSINDLRLAASYLVADWLRVGVGAHAFSGRDVLSQTRVFDDSLKYGGQNQQNTITFGGNAVSVGAVALFPGVGGLGVSYRRGGTLQAMSGDSLVGTGHAPDHLGVSFSYLGINGATLAARLAKDSWSNLAGVAGTLNVHESWDIGVGGNIAGPQLAGGTTSFRVGGRWRTLPFAAKPSSSAVKERSWSLGGAMPLALGRAELSVGVIRSTRSGDAGVNENAWTISTGFLLRP